MYKSYISLICLTILSLDSSTTPVMIIVKGIDDAGEKAALLNSLTDKINTGSVSIQFKCARVGSLILHVTILNRVFQHHSTLMYELYNFLERVFKMGNKLEFDPIAEMNIVLIADEGKYLFCTSNVLLVFRTECPSFGGFSLCFYFIWRLFNSHHDSLYSTLLFSVREEGVYIMWIE